MLLSVESSVAIISICLPRIFNMLRKGFVHLSTSSNGAMSPVDGLNSPAPLRMGLLALPDHIQSGAKRSAHTSLESAPPPTIVHRDYG